MYLSFKKYSTTVYMYINFKLTYYRLLVGAPASQRVRYQSGDVYMCRMNSNDDCQAMDFHEDGRCLK